MPDNAATLPDCFVEWVAALPGIVDNPSLFTLFCPVQWISTTPGGVSNLTTTQHLSSGLYVGNLCVFPAKM